GRLRARGADRALERHARRAPLQRATVGGLCPPAPDGESLLPNVGVGAVGRCERAHGALRRRRAHSRRGSARPRRARGRPRHRPRGRARRVGRSALARRGHGLSTAALSRDASGVIALDKPEHWTSHDAYARARAGEVVTLQARTVQVARLDVISTAAPDVRLLVVCSSGTYVRSLARDLGRALGSAAHLAALRRLAVGALEARDALRADL